LDTSSLEIKYACVYPFLPAVHRRKSTVEIELIVIYAPELHRGTKLAAESTQFKAGEPASLIGQVELRS